MNNYWRDTIRVSTVVLALWVSALVVGASFAQAGATVTVQISVPGDFPVKKELDLRVRAIPTSSDSGAKSSSWKLGNGNFNYTEHFYEYKFQGLSPVEYAFIVCDGLEYLPDIRRLTIQPGSNRDPVVFSLKTPKPQDFEDQTSPTLRGPDGQPIGRDTPVFLKDAVTGCKVDSTKAERGGVAKFHHVPKRNYEYESEADDRDP